eukprot:scaffold1663_cov71-Phaeocystis_antarctica.AAC.1
MSHVSIGDPSVALRSMGSRPSAARHQTCTDTHFCCSGLPSTALAAGCQSPSSLHSATQVASGALVAGYNSEGVTGDDAARAAGRTGSVDGEPTRWCLYPLGPSTFAP